MPLLVASASILRSFSLTRQRRNAFRAQTVPVWSLYSFEKTTRCQHRSGVVYAAAESEQSALFSQRPADTAETANGPTNP